MTNAIQLSNAVINPPIKLNPADMCCKEDFLSKINEYVLKYQDTKKEDHINNIILHNIIKKSSEFFDTLYQIKNTIKGLKNNPVLLSAFFTGLQQTCSEYYSCISINGKYQIDIINSIINEHIL